MKCPECGSKTKVINSRTSNEISTRRRRECLSCGGRFTTYEKIIEEPQRGKPRIRNYTAEQFLKLARESKTLSDMGEKLNITKERVRQLSILLGIRKQMLSILKKNRLRSKNGTE